MAIDDGAPRETTRWRLQDETVTMAPRAPPDPKTQEPPLKNIRVLVVVEHLYPYILKISPYIDPHF